MTAGRSIRDPFPGYEGTAEFSLGQSNGSMLHCGEFRSAQDEPGNLTLGFTV